MEIRLLSILARLLDSQPVTVSFHSTILQSDNVEDEIGVWVL